nr:hypothetical protein Iba_chr06cCG10420 [Ipomoea batatas]
MPSPTPPLPDGEAPVGCPGRSPSLTLGLQVAVSPSRGHRLSRHYRSPPLAVASARSPIHVAVAVSQSDTPRLQVAVAVSHSRTPVASRSAVLEAS